MNRIKKAVLLGSLISTGIAWADPGELDSRFGFAPDFIGFGPGYITLDDVGERWHAKGDNVDMTVDAEGRTLIAEAWHGDAMSTNTQVFLRRLDVDGQLDVTFGVSSIASPGYTLGSMKTARRDRTDIPQVAVAAYRPAVSWQYIGDPTKIFQAVGIDNEVHVLAYRANGQLDTSFGPDRNGHMVFTLAGQVGYGLDMVVDRGVITLVTSSDDRGETRRNCSVLCRMAIMRMDMNGQPLYDYGTNGIGYYAIDNGTGAKNRLNTIAVNRTNGRLYVAGRVQRAGRADIDLVLGRLDINGYPDSNFGPEGTWMPGSSSGFVTLGIPDVFEWGMSLVIEQSGRVVVAGYEDTAGDGITLQRGTIWGFTANGWRDPTFGDHGKALIWAPPYFYGLGDSTLIHDAALDTEGRIVVAGSIARSMSGPVPGEPSFESHGYIARLDANGHMDFGFGTAWGAGGVSETTASATCVKIGVSNERPMCLGYEPIDTYATGRLRVLGFQP